MREYTKEEICSALDYAVLKPTATRDDVRCACALANKHNIKSVCVAPTYVPFAASLFDNVSCVVGFPHGNAGPSVKHMEAILAVECGAKELDVVVNYGRFLDGDSKPMYTELEYIVNYAHNHDVIVKAILETCYHNVSQLFEACRILSRCEVDFVKTSTGFAKEGVTSGDIIVICDAIKDLHSTMQIKASGGIKTYNDAATLLDLGCTRIGSGSFHSLLPQEEGSYEQLT